jgi:hypothetical protein
MGKVELESLGNSLVFPQPEGIKGMFLCMAYCTVYSMYLLM